MATVSMGRGNYCALTRFVPIRSFSLTFISLLLAVVVVVDVLPSSLTHLPSSWGLHIRFLLLSLYPCRSLLAPLQIRQRLTFTVKYNNVYREIVDKKGIEMTLSQNLRHRHAVAAAQRRAPNPAPQLGFDPTAIFNQPTDGKGFKHRIPPATTTNVISLPTPSSSSTVQTSSSTLSSVSSSSSSTTTSTTTSSALPTTTSTTPVVVTTTSSTPELITTMPTQTAMVTVSVTRSTSSFTSAAASASSTPAASSGTSTGAVVGGIGAGIVAIAALVFAVTFFIRRSRKRDNDGGFDEQDFRRSAVMLNDPPTHDDTVARGFNPRPPTMIERHLASPAPTFGAQYGHPGPAYNHDSVGYPESYAGYAASFQSFAPGQVMNNAPSPMTPNSAYPLYPAAPSAQSPFSPVSPREQYQFENPRQPPVGAGAGYPVLTRQASSHSQSSEGQGQPGSPTTMRRESLPANDYVDLNRSSVSPYQAAQYVEISRRLNTEVPEGLHTAALERELPPLPPPKFSSDAADGVSPFADPASAPPSPGGQYAFDHRHLEASQEHTRPVSGESFGSQEQTAPLEFPVPPSPALTPTSRYRIDSMPPTLPEINVESRVSVGGYPMLGTGPGARSSDAVGGMLTATGSRFPITPSPLASSFGMPSPPPAAAMKSFDAGVVKNEQSAAVVGGEKKRNTVYSMYDPEDAYGGI